MTSGCQPTVAVCVLSSRELVGPLGKLPGVAMVGTLMTANLGIEELIRSLAANPAITSLLVCGRESPWFRAGQSLVSLLRYGMDSDRSIRGATGYHPVLPTISAAEIAHVQASVNLTDARGERDVQILAEQIAKSAVRQAAELDCCVAAPPASTVTGFRTLPAGGRRQPLRDEIGGFIVISVNSECRKIVLRQYASDLSPMHEMTGIRAEAMLLGLLEAKVTTELSHAGYLGAELTKAETALRLGLQYEQDQPLRTATAERLGGSSL